jgi:uncharacterized protein (TIGR02246 family)
MFRWGISILLMLFNFAFALETTDQEAIKKVITAYTQAWNEQGGKGFADGFAQDADFVNIFGMKFSGKEEIEARHINILQTFLKNSKMEILRTHLREVQKGLVIATIYWRVKGFKKPDAIQDGIFTQVFIQQEEKWEITASQNTLIPNS